MGRSVVDERPCLTRAKVRVLLLAPRPTTCSDGTWLCRYLLVYVFRPTTCSDGMWLCCYLLVYVSRPMTCSDGLFLFLTRLVSSRLPP